MRRSDARSQLTFILFILTVIVLFVGCSGSIEKDVVGKWVETGKPGYAEFFANKSMTLNDGKIDFTGSWSIVNKNGLKLQFTAMGKQQIITWDNVRIEGDTMIIAIGSVDYKFKLNK